MPLTRVMLQPPQWGSSDLHQQNCHCNIRLFSRWLGYSLSARGWFHPTSEPDLPISSPSTCPLLSPNISVTLLYPPKSSAPPQTCSILPCVGDLAEASQCTSFYQCSLLLSCCRSAIQQFCDNSWWIILSYLVNHTLGESYYHMTYNMDIGVVSLVVGRKDRIRPSIT